MCAPNAGFEEGIIPQLLWLHTAAPRGSCDSVWELLDYRNVGTVQIIWIILLEIEFLDEFYEIKQMSSNLKRNLGEHPPPPPPPKLYPLWANSFAFFFFQKKE